MPVPGSNRGRDADRDAMPTPMNGGDENPGRQLAMYALARDVLDGLNTQRPPAMPDRPADLPDDDNELHTLLKTARGRHEGRLPEDEKRVQRVFARWKEQIMQRESESRGCLLLLVRTLRTLEGIDDPDLEESREHLRNHMRSYWPTFDVHAIPLEGEVSDFDKVMRRAVRREDLVPGWLLYGGDPPRYDPMAHRANEPHWQDDPDGQEEL